MSIDERRSKQILKIRWKKKHEKLLKEKGLSPTQYNRILDEVYNIKIENGNLSKTLYPSDIDVAMDRLRKHEDKSSVIVIPNYQTFNEISPDTSEFFSAWTRNKRSRMANERQLYEEDNDVDIHDKAISNIVALQNVKDAEYYDEMVRRWRDQEIVPMVDNVSVVEYLHDIDAGYNDVPMDVNFLDHGDGALLVERPNFTGTVSNKFNVSGHMRGVSDKHIKRMLEPLAYHSAQSGKRRKKVVF